MCSDDFTKNALPCDVLVGGYPCQPFSTEGLALGAADPRASVIAAILAYVKRCMPRLLVLENVVGLYKRHKEFFLEILLTIQTMGYSVSLSILDSATVGAVAQRRRRLYHVGVRGKGLRIQWPGRIPAVPLVEMIDDTTFCERLPCGRSNTGHRRRVRMLLKILKEKGLNYRRVRMVFDCDGRSPHFLIDKVPCLTRARAAKCYLLVWKGWRLNVKEMMRLQAMQPDRLRFDGLGLSDRQIWQMIGNAFTQSVVGRVLVKLLPVAGLTGLLSDQWLKNLFG